MTVRARAAYFARAAAQDLRHAPFVHLVSVVALAVALLGLGLVRSGMSLTDGLLGELRTDVQLTVFLHDGVSPAEAERVRQGLETRSGGHTQLVSPSEALNRLARELGPSGQSLSGLPENPLPFSIEVQVPAQKHDPASLATLADQIRALPEVDTVDYGVEAVTRLSRLNLALRAGGMIALVLLGVATVVTVTATFQLAIYARRTEVEIQKLVGATDLFVRTPFVVEGLLQGTLAAALACLALWAGLRGMRDSLQELLTFIGLPPEFAPVLNPRRALELWAAGLLLGFFGSVFAVRRFLRT